ncbi:subtilisin-like protein [Tothia fuscella]|uniref:tripeptidyl-peptidase II n=1 Tax=Tothia fuscella TaxID=1048955 RepID=A0A9P4TVQ5_9PEZI|nr:subtilisin-like protein [Tothia fuscella]
MIFSSSFPLSIAVLYAYSCRASSAITARSSYAVKEKHAPPPSWVKKGPASGSNAINLRIGLRQQNEGAVEKHLLQVSDPSHERYGQHLSASEIHSIITPLDKTLELVSDWLTSNNVFDFQHNTAKDWISVTLPIEKAEGLLQTKYYIFEHKHDGSTVARAPEWSLPVHLHEHIDVVQPTNSFFRPTPRAPIMHEVKESEKRAKHIVFDDAPEHDKSWWGREGKAYYTSKPVNAASKSSQIAALCNISFTTLDCIRTLYDTIDYVPQATDKNSIGICNYLNETSSRADTTLFFQTFRPEAIEAAADFEIVIIDNGENDQEPLSADEVTAGKNIEGNLDAQLVLGISYPTPMVAWNTGGSPPFIPDLATPTNTNEPYLVWLNYVLSQQNLPSVISTSYGDDEQTVPYSYAKRVCADFAQLGARGISVLFSSGDNGVGNDGQCFSNTDPAKGMFLPAFPTGCPWVTSVGGTEDFQPEVAVKRYGSGAGFSNYFGAPTYQTKTVNDYVQGLNGLYDGLYNKSGRAYPDVAAQGNRDAIAWNGIIRTIGGTSASCPAFSAVIALVNDALIADGKPVLGFLNPWIYGGAHKALTDVTSGSSFGCNVTGFPAKQGWDAVTGWGTPDFGLLVDAAFEKYGGSYPDLRKHH